MRKPWGVLLSLLFLAGKCGVADPGMTGRENFSLSESELNRLSLEVMSGNSDAARRISDYYRLVASHTVENDVLVIEWEMIGAENGSLASQSETGDLLSIQALKKLTNQADNKPPTRTVFWWRLCFKNGGNRIISKLAYNGLSENFDIPPDSSFPASYTAISAETISACEEGALQGSGRAALLLAQYYGNIAGDAGLSEYWYRIGAQNGNAECQHNLGLIYQAKPEEMNKVRGTFWLNKAAENGYVGP